MTRVVPQTDGYSDCVPLTARSRLHRRLPARPESIAELRCAVVQFAADSGFSAHRRDDIALAVSEALSNVVVHAYEGCDAPGEMRVEAQVDGAALQVAVCDDGIGMTARRDSPGLGLGLALMGQVTDTLGVQSRGPAPGVHVQMTFMQR